jgi:hypothetical protein
VYAELHDRECTHTAPEFNCLPLPLVVAQCVGGGVSLAEMNRVEHLAP